MVLAFTCRVVIIETEPSELTTQYGEETPAGQLQWVAIAIPFSEA